MGNILLFYQYTDIADPKKLVEEQRALCVRLGLTGRILIAKEGINGTVGGPQEATSVYIEHMRKIPAFAEIDFKTSPGDASYFPKLKVLHRDTIVNLGISPEHASADNGGTHLSPDAWHNIMKQEKENVVILDARNTYESRIGAFEGAIKPDIGHFRDLPAFIENNPELFQDKDVLMYCTGGIRCERASAYLKEQDIANNVYQLSGGIHRYAEQYDDGFFRGKNYVFDKRISQRITDDVLTTCDTCEAPCDMYTNCINALCSKHCILCADCLYAYNNTCSQKCLDLITSNTIHCRTEVRAAE